MKRNYWPWHVWCVCYRVTFANVFFLPVDTRSLRGDSNSFPATELETEREGNQAREKGDRVPGLVAGNQGNGKETTKRQTVFSPLAIPRAESAIAVAIEFSQRSHSEI